MGTNSSQPLPSQQGETGAVQTAMAQPQDRKPLMSAEASGASHGPLLVANNRKRKDSDARYENDGARTKKRSRKHDEEPNLQVRGPAAEVSNGTIKETDIPQNESGVNNGLKKKERKHRKENGHGDDFPKMTLNEKQTREEKKKKKHMTVGNGTPDSNSFNMTSMNLQLANGSSIPTVSTTQTSTIQPKEKKKKRTEYSETSQSQCPVASQTPTNHRSSKDGAIQFTPVNREANSTMIKPSRNSRSMERTMVGDVIPPRILANGPKGGLWTEEEKAIVDEVFHHVCAVERIDESELAENVAAGEKITTFLNCLREALPMRTRDSIRKFCQRQYRRGTRGPWSAEEDATLQDQIAQRGKKWAEIARIVDRTPDDCRDRYQKILQYGSDREQGTWSQQDALRLYRAVEECVAEIVDYTDGDVYDFVNWEVVANKMGHRRSAKRCREKWQKLRERGFSDQMSLKEWTEDSSRLHWRHGAAEKQFAYFKNGDKYDALMEVYSSFRDPTEIFPSEQSFWTRVSAHIGESRFDKRLRRLVFYHLLEQCGSSSIREEASKAMQAKLMAELIVQEAQKTGEELERGYNEDCFYHPVAKARRVKAEALRKANAAQKRRQKSHRSEEFVYESDDSRHSPAQAELSLLLASGSQGVNESLADVHPSRHETSGTTDALAMSPHLQSGSSGAGSQKETAAEHRHSTLAEKASSNTHADRTPRKKARKQKTGLAPADHDLPAFLTPSQLSAKHTQDNEGDEIMGNHVDDEEARRLKKLEKKRRKEERRRRRLNE